MKKYGSYLKKPLACGFFLALMLISVTAFGDTIRVPADYSTIQAGIDAASNGDTVLVADGTYKGTGNKNLSFGGKRITVRSENGPENTVIDCEGDGRGFIFNNNETESSILDGFTIINGHAGHGGGIYSLYSPTIRNCKIIGNRADNSGGGISTALFGAKIINCIIAGNTATWGGGIHINSAEWTEVINCTIFGNTATHYGGGILFTTCSPTVTNSILWWDSPEEIYLVVDGNPAPNITYCDIEGTSFTGPTIMHSCPQLVDVSDPDPVNWDLHLQPGSPCIDAGTSEGAPDDDIDGDARPQGAGYDMGADEYNGTLPPPVAHFSASPTSGIAPLTVNFTDQSTGQITSWSWDFGDGSTSTEQSPSHTYNNSGIYTVTLTVAGPEGSDKETKTDYIKVRSPARVMPWIPLLLFEDASQVPRAKLSISYDPNPVPVYTGNSPCFSTTEWHYTTYVSETAGVGLTVNRWTADFYDQNGDHITQQERSSSDFADRFNDCGPGSAIIAPNSTVCGSACATLGGRPSGSVVYTFYGTDTNGNSVSESARVYFSAAETSSTTWEKKEYSLPGVKSR